MSLKIFYAAENLGVGSGLDLATRISEVLIQNNAINFCFEFFPYGKRSHPLLDEIFHINVLHPAIYGSQKREIIPIT